ncbi:ankyrin repeat domain-containing protein 31-like [Huso huso]|uniref:Ankyrin repeat domain-containing protein 31-like n=1 Tax=Huso huso TaxID=61971 RepID=A0ABR1ACR6_HUSHU
METEKMGGKEDRTTRHFQGPAQTMPDENNKNELLDPYCSSSDSTSDCKSDITVDFTKWSLADFEADEWELRATQDFVTQNTSSEDEDDECVAAFCGGSFTSENLLSLNSFVPLETQSVKSSLFGTTAMDKVLDTTDTEKNPADNEAPSTSCAQAAVDTDKPTASLPCPSKRNCSGQTQLQVAAMKGDLSLVKEHLRVWKCFNKRRVNLSDYAGWTALHQACYHGFTEVIMELLEAGADVNIRGRDRELPLHLAVSGSNYEAVKLLLEYGSNPCVKDGFGKSALDLATDDRIKEILLLYWDSEEETIAERVKSSRQKNGATDLGPIQPKRRKKSSRGKANETPCNFYMVCKITEPADSLCEARNQCEEGKSEAVQTVQNNDSHDLLQLPAGSNGVKYREKIEAEEAQQDLQMEDGVRNDCSIVLNPSDDNVSIESKNKLRRNDNPCAFFGECEIIEAENNLWEEERKTVQTSNSSADLLQPAGDGNKVIAFGRSTLIQHKNSGPDSALKGREVAGTHNEIPMQVDKKELIISCTSAVSSGSNVLDALTECTNPSSGLCSKDMTKWGAETVLENIDESNISLNVSRQNRTGFNTIQACVSVYEGSTVAESEKFSDSSTPSLLMEAEVNQSECSIPLPATQINSNALLGIHEAFSASDCSERDSFSVLERVSDLKELNCDPQSTFSSEKVRSIQQCSPKQSNGTSSNRKEIQEEDAQLNVSDYSTSSSCTQISSNEYIQHGNNRQSPMIEESERPTTKSTSIQGQSMESHHPDNIFQTTIIKESSKTDVLGSIGEESNLMKLNGNPQPTLNLEKAESSQQCSPEVSNMCRIKDKELSEEASGTSKQELAMLKMLPTCTSMATKEQGSELETKIILQSKMQTANVVPESRMDSIECVDQLCVKTGNTSGCESNIRVDLVNQKQCSSAQSENLGVTNVNKMHTEEVSRVETNTDIIGDVCVSDAGKRQDNVVLGLKSDGNTLTSNSSCVSNSKLQATPVAVEASTSGPEEGKEERNSTTDSDCTVISEFDPADIENPDIMEAVAKKTSRLQQQVNTAFGNAAKNIGSSAVNEENGERKITNKETVPDQRENHSKPKELSKADDKESVSVDEILYDKPEDTRVPCTSGASKQFPASLPVPISSVHKRNSMGETRLHLAAKKGDLSLTRSLIEAGVKVNQADYAGWTALHEASFRGFTAVMKELLKAGADVNIRGLESVLPIHDAVSACHYEAVKLLLQYGANPHDKDGVGKCALDQAKDDKIKELLLPFSASSAIYVEKSPIATVLETETRVRKAPVKCVCCKSDKKPHRTQFVKDEDSHCTDETITTLLDDVEDKQKKMSQWEFKELKDTGKYREQFLQMQVVLNEVLIKQKAEKDDLAKKYRISSDSFKQGILRQRLTSLANRQKRLLKVLQKQDELKQNIQTQRNTLFNMQSNITQTIRLTQASENATVTDITAGCHQDPIVLKGRVEGARSVVEVASEETASTSTASSPHQDRTHILEGHCFSMPSSPDSGSQASSELAETLSSASSETATHGIKSYHATDCDIAGSEPSCISRPPFSADFISTHLQIEHSYPKFNSQTALSEHITSSSDQKKNKSINNNQYRPNIQTTLQNTKEDNSNIHDMPLSSYSQEKAQAGLICQGGSQQSRPESSTAVPVVLQTATENNISQKSSAHIQVIQSVVQDQGASKSNTSQPDTPLQQGDTEEEKRKKQQLIHLIRLRVIKPGEDVLQVNLQGSCYKAALLHDGSIKVGNGSVFHSPVQWIKTLLGNDIPFSSTFAWSKVTYKGKELSKYFSIVDPVITTEKALPSLQPKTMSAPLPKPAVCAETAFQTNTRNFLELNEILLISNDEFLPCHIMDRHWILFMECEDFAF